MVSFAAISSQNPAGHFLVDPFVAEDHELLLLGGDEEEHAVAQRGLGHAEALERPLRDVADVAADRLRLDVDADLAGRLAFRGCRSRPTMRG